MYIYVGVGALADVMHDENSEEEVTNNIDGGTTIEAKHSGWATITMHSV